MSNALAVAATTATLRNLLLTEVPLLDATLSDLDVTTQPLDLARKGVTKAQLNLFLYQTVQNAGWRNLDPPRQVRNGERGAPALALNLHYLITAYGRGDSDNDATSHRVLGGALSVLHDHPVLGATEIGNALPGNDLSGQFERVKVTPLGISVEEMSKLWTMCQAQYRLSAAYEVTVILIDSRTAVKAPLPVLRRGSEDQGVTTTATPLPHLASLRLPRLQSAARLGEDVTLVGDALSATHTVVRLTNTRLNAPVELVPEGAGGSELSVHLPDESEDASALSRWAPGLYTAGLVVNRPGMPALTSNEIVFALAPRISVSPLTAAAGTVNLSVVCRPRVAPEQRVVLLFGDRQIASGATNTPADPTLPTTLSFSVPDVSAGSYVVRLRVDGVDSIPVVNAGTPSFDPAQKVTVS